MKISVLLEALTGSFDTDIDRSTKSAQKKLEAFEKKANDTFKQLATIGVAAGAAFAAFTKTQIDVADKINKLSQSTGIAVETLSGLQLAAELSDVSLEDLGTAMAKLAKNAAAAAAGSKEQAKAFDLIGVSVKNADGTLKGTDQLLSELADAFAGVEDGTAKAALAQQIFGKSGASLIPLLNAGSDGLKSMRDEASALGLTLSKETAEAAEKFNDNLTRLEAAAQGVARAVAADLLGPMNQFTDQMVEAVKTSSEFKETAEKIALGFAIIAESAHFLVDAMYALAGSFEVVFEDLKTLAVFVEHGGAPGLLFKSNRDALEQQLQERNNVLSDANDRWSKLWNNNYTTLSTSIEQSINAAKVGTTDLKETLKAATNFSDLGAPLFLSPEVRKQMDQSIPFAIGKGPGSPADAAPKRQIKIVDEGDSKERDKLISDLEKIQLGFSEATKAQDEFDKGIGVLQDALAEGLIDQNQFDQLAANLKTNFWAKIQDDGKKTSDFMTEAWKEAARNIQDTLAEFLFEPFKDGLSGMVQGFADALRRMAANAAAAQLFNSIGEWGKSNSGAGGFLGFLATGADKLFSGAKAGGGDVFGDRSYLVGENGPEMFVPRTAGSIVPMNSNWSGGLQQVFNITTPDADSFRQSQRQIMRRSRQRIGL